MADLPEEMASWVNRALPKIHPLHSVSEYPDHHIAAVRCLGCDRTAVAVYPTDCDVLRMECPSCGNRGAEIVRYLKRVWKQ